ncbi:TPA: hypothetical protein ACH3X1_011241 [Trebouxia sp. C0004]
MGAEKFRQTVSKYIGYDLKPGKHITGVHPQRQEGLFWVGACIPVGRLQSDDMDDLAHIAETYGDGTMRMTVEQDVIFPNVPEKNLEAMQQEPMFQSTVHSKLQSPLFSVALQNRLSAGSLSLQLQLWRFVLHTGSQQAVCHCSCSYGDLFFIQVCKAMAYGLSSGLLPQKALTVSARTAETFL